MEVRVACMPFEREEFHEAFELILERDGPPQIETNGKPEGCWSHLSQNTKHPFVWKESLPRVSGQTLILYVCVYTLVPNTKTPHYYCRYK